MSPGTRRLLKEAAELRASPSPHFCAHPVSDNLYDWHFTLAGPPAPSPYADGIYHGRIVLPPTYPLRPPSFRFLTPSGRFEVNREICLSISGHHEESWQPAWGIRTALLAIRSFMDGDARGQVGGLDVGDDVRRDYAGKSRAWRCDACEKSNAEILKEWEGICIEAGVVSGGDLDAGAGRGESGRDVVRADADADARPRASETGDASSGAEIPSSHVSRPVDDPVPVPIEQQQQQQQQQSAPVSTPTPAVTPVAPAPAPVPAPTPTQQPVRPQQTSDGPWLDRAIIGVLVALMIMVLRRVARSEDPY